MGAAPMFSMSRRLLQDRWYDDVAPRIRYALVFTPFCHDLRWNRSASSRGPAPADAG